MRRLLLIGGLVWAFCVVAPAAAAAATISHVVWVVMENHGYGSIIGSSQAPYINQLANTYGLATNYRALAHPSLPNYVALTSGGTQGVTDDSGTSTYPLNVPSIFSQLRGGQSRSLQESMPSNCRKSDSGQYVLHHNPMAYYTNLGTDCSKFDVPFGASPDLSAAFTFITPNATHDMLDGTVAQGNSFLSTYVPALMATSQYQAGNTAIFITWDEDENSGANNQVATIVVSPYTKAVKVATAYSHYSLLRTAEDLLGLPPIGNAATAAPMEAAFGLTGSPPPPPSPPSNTALPTISGGTQQGQTLTTTNGTWTNSPTAFAYQWQDCDASGTNCNSIPGATSSSHLLSSGDVGQTIRVVVVASNAAGQGVATSAQTAAITAATPPSNTALPTISGTAQQGQTLTTTNGAWTGTAPLSFAYQWQRCDTGGGNCTAIGTATGSAYTLQSADVGDTIRVVVTASNAAGSSSATSAPTAVVGALSHDPVVVAEGDIACAPGDTSDDCEQSLTASLAAAQHPDAVLLLGDNQYNSGLLSEYTGAGAYGADVGHLQPDRVPRPRQPRVHGEPGRRGLLQLFQQRAARINRIRPVLLVQPRQLAHHLARLELQRFRLLRCGAG